MPSAHTAQEFVTTNGIGAKYISGSDILLIAVPGGEPLPQLLERAAGGIGEILTEESQIGRLGNSLGGKTRAQMEEAFSVAARSDYNKVVFSTE